MITSFFFLTDFCIFKKKKYYHTKKTVITFQFFLKRNCHFRSLESEKMQKVSYLGINLMQFWEKYFLLRALIWQKKVIKLIKVCETDFQIRAPESKKHTFISTFLLKFSNTPSREQKTHYQINFFGENLVNEFVDQHYVKHSRKIE